MIYWELSKDELLNRKYELLLELQGCLEDLEEIDNVYSHKTESLDIIKNSQEIIAWIEKYEEICERASSVYQVIYLLYSTHMKDSDCEKLYNLCKKKIEKVRLYNEKIKRFFTLQLDEKIKEAMKRTSYKKYKYYIEKIYLEKQHTVSKDMENILSQVKVYAMKAAGELYSQITNRYKYSININGKTKKLSFPEIVPLFKDTNRNIRKSAKQGFIDRYKQDDWLITNIYNNMVQCNNIQRQIKRFKSPISIKNSENNIEDYIVKMAIEIITDYNGLVQNYYDWKSKILGYKMEHWDTTASLKKLQERYSIKEAEEILLETFYQFDNEFGNIAKAFFVEKRIDSSITDDKRKGAFCFSALPDYKPYISVNFNGKVEDVITLAHELGHGIHKTFCSRENYLNYSPSLVISETAAGFCELLVIDRLNNYLYEEDKNKLLITKLENFILPIFTMNLITRFEINAHKEIVKNGFLSFEELCELYIKEWNRVYGDSVHLSKEVYYYWMIYPHIFKDPFYMYSYSLANMLSVAVYYLNMQRGKNFVKKYKELLSSGCNNSTPNLLSIIGIEMADKKFWDDIFTTLKNEFFKKIIK
ncbi:oligoendopeptidase F [Paramaledivibacter caminithermalis DSM 15212]|uniref:Oligoendopeptidase F n=1 Tax=Paramaledivibacter caminithermalis (strain DSM 15212 / CIP 107654 / DViRD3) TaxID=1121301 RepID=A0A1M6P3I7_PARC5|nr:oligoendopeptidase F [Paramaledivibacter caminithermalis DSM 15212]